MVSRLSLPIDPHLPLIAKKLQESGCLVLKASPGSGKTTRVAPFLLNSLPPGKEILVLEPRRLAAKLAARRVAEERREKVGGVIGYQFRFENVSSKETRLRFLTEGMLMRRLIRDRTLDGVAIVILDEFHERHLHGDVALSYLRSLQASGRPDLKLVVMSATLDTEALLRYLGNCPLVEVEGRPFDVATHYRPSENKFLEISVRDAVKTAFQEWPEGDCLVFLPGMADIRRAESALSDLARINHWDLFPLHGELSKGEQDRALLPGRNRKIILATNVAETSLTIEGIRIVIDSGLHRQASYSWWSGVPSLRTRPISRASSIQRAGRAGRTASGTCYRLYSRADFDGRAPFETPEIQRADLCQTLLELKELGVQSLTQFPWFDPPPAGAMESAEATLPQDRRA